MTLTIELTPEEAAQLRTLAQAKGTDESGAIRELLSPTPVENSAQEKADLARALFARWHAEDDLMTPGEIAAEEAAWETVSQGLQENQIAFRTPDASDRA